MYPGIIAQIEGVKRVLKDVIRPALDSRYARDVLHWSVRVLNLVATEVMVAHPVNLREIEAIKRLFDRILPELRRHVESGALAPALVERVSLAVDGTIGDPTDMMMTETRLNQLRDIAAQIVRALAYQEGAETITAAVQAYVCDLAEINGAAFGLKSYA